MHCPAPHPGWWGRYTLPKPWEERRRDKIEKTEKGEPQPASPAYNSRHLIPSDPASHSASWEEWALPWGTTACSRLSFFFFFFFCFYWRLPADTASPLRWHPSRKWWPQSHLGSPSPTTCKVGDCTKALIDAPFPSAPCSTTPMQPTADFSPSSFHAYSTPVHCTTAHQNWICICLLPRFFWCSLLSFGYPRRTGDTLFSLSRRPCQSLCCCRCSRARGVTFDHAPHLKFPLCARA